MDSTFERDGVLMRDHDLATLAYRGRRKRGHSRADLIDNGRAISKTTALTTVE